MAATDLAFDPGELWPAHEWDSWRTPVPLKGPYVGAAGVIFALDVLRRRSLAETRIHLEHVAERALAGAELVWQAGPHELGLGGFGEILLCRRAARRRANSAKPS